MTYSIETGYTGKSFDDYVLDIISYVNKRTGSNYTIETFRDTNYYAAYYPLIQSIMEQDNNFSVIFEKLNNFISVSNESINDPQITKNSLITAFQNYSYKDSSGNNIPFPIKISILKLLNPKNDYDSITTFLASIIVSGGGTITQEQALEFSNNIINIKKAAGNMYCCVDVDNYNTISKNDICKLFNTHTPFGLVYQGEEEEVFNLSNGDQFTYKWDLPETTALWLKLDLKTDRNNLDIPVDTIDNIKHKLQTNLNTIYKVGLDFEVDKYLNVDRDLKWCSEIIFSWSKNTLNQPITEINDWSTQIIYNDYKDKMVFDLASHILINIS
jgi:hypothetical protein